MSGYADVGTNHFLNKPFISGNRVPLRLRIAQLCSFNSWAIRGTKTARETVRILALVLA